MPVLASVIDVPTEKEEVVVKKDKADYNQTNNKCGFPTKDCFDFKKDDAKSEDDLIEPKLVSLLDEAIDFDKIIPSNPKLTLPLRLLSFPDSPNKLVDPNSFRITLRAVPNTTKLLKKTSLPLTLVVTPYRRREPNNNIPVIKDPPIYCRQCKTYLSPFTILYLDGWKCVVCQYGKYIPDMENYENKDFHSQLALQHNLVEYQLTTEPIEVSPSLVFVLDTSQLAIQNGSLVMVLNSILGCLDLIPNLQRNLKVGFVTFNTNSIQFYKLNLGSKTWELIVISDLDDYEHVPPHPNQLLVDLAEFRVEIEDLLVRILNLSPITSIATNQSSNRVLEVGLHITNLMLKPSGGKILVFTSTCPPPSPVLITESTTQTYLPAWLKPATFEQYQPDSDTYYKQLAMAGIENKVAFDLFLFGNEVTKELVNLSCLTKYTGGELFTYPQFPSFDSNDQFKTNLKVCLTSEWAFDCTFSTSYFGDLYPGHTYGHLYQHQSKTIIRPCTYFNWTYLVEVNYEYNFYDKFYMAFQSKMTYTGQDGLKYLRVMTLALPVTQVQSELVCSYDPTAILVTITHLVLDTLLNHGVTKARAQLKTLYQNLIHSLQKIEGRPKVSLMMPNNLMHIPLVLKALNYHEVLKDTDSIKLSDRYMLIYTLMKLSPDELISFLIPKLYKLNASTLTLSQEGLSQLKLTKLPLNQAYFMMDLDEFHILDTRDNLIIIMNPQLQNQLELDLKPHSTHHMLNYSQLPTPLKQLLIHLTRSYNTLPKFHIVPTSNHNLVLKYLLLDRLDYPRCLTQHVP